MIKILNNMRIIIFNIIVKRIKFKIYEINAIIIINKYFTLYLFIVAYLYLIIANKINISFILCTL